MTFDPDARIDGSSVRRRGRGRTAGLAGGGISLAAVAVFLIAQFTGVDLGRLVGGGGVGGSGAQPVVGEQLGQCETGADANEDISCRMAGAATSLDVYWEREAPTLGIGDYVEPDFFLFTSSTTTGCGGATSATGPFYCPPDQALYVDTDFFDQLRQQYGATAGPLAQLYVVGHEWGHHVQQLTGAFARADRSGTGPTSDSVRLEVQADCYAGAWLGAASSLKDVEGVTFLEPITDAQITDALDAAATVGDDRIQEASGGEVDSDSWTHGSAEQRQRWFTQGFEQGATACDTFAVPGEQL
ncbi:KPN_02809 family neutral zinc metallopeptidase [Frigoribacterium salinisoli]